MLTLNEIVNNTIVHTRDLVGDMLSTLPKTNFKSVIDRRQKGPIPPLPYITVDSLGYRDQDGWQVNAGAVEAVHPVTGVMDYYPFYDRNVEFMLDFYCYGEECQDILRNLKGSFNFDTVRERVFSDSDVRLVRSGPIRRTPDLLSTDFRDSATMSVRYAAIDRFIDFGGGVLRTITYDSSLVDENGNVSTIPTENVNT